MGDDFEMFWMWVGGAEHEKTLENQGFFVLP